MGRRSWFVWLLLKQHARVCAATTVARVCMQVVAVFAIYYSAQAAPLGSYDKLELSTRRTSLRAARLKRTCCVQIVTASAKVDEIS